MRNNYSSISAHHACELSPHLAKLTALSFESLRRLEAIKPLLPHQLKTSIQAGPVDGDNWCLIVSNAAIANKLKHFTPIILSALNDQGCAITNIRIKILSSS